MFLGVASQKLMLFRGAWPGKVWEHPVVFLPINDNRLGRKDWRPPAKCTIALNCNPEMCETCTCTNRGMVCMLAISPLLMGSLAMMWSAPVQPSTISSIRTPSCTEQEGERGAVRVFQRQKEDGHEITIGCVLVFWFLTTGLETLQSEVTCLLFQEDFSELATVWSRKTDFLLWLHYWIIFIEVAKSPSHNYWNFWEKVTWICNANLNEAAISFEFSRIFAKTYFLEYIYIYILGLSVDYTF